MSDCKTQATFISFTIELIVVSTIPLFFGVHTDLAVFALVGGKSHRIFPLLCSKGSHRFNEIQQKSNSTEN